MGDTSPPRRVRRHLRPRTASKTASAKRCRTTVEMTDAIVTDYGVMRRTMEAIVEQSDITSALRSVGPMED